MRLFNLLMLIVATFGVNASEPTEISIAGYGGNDIFAVNQLVKEVLKDDLAEAGIKVNYFAIESDYPKYILNALSSGNAPDAFYMNSEVAQAWISIGKLAPLPTDLLDQRTSIHPVLTEVFSLEGKTYGLAKDMNALALIFNKDVFRDANVSFPSDADSWTDLKNKLQQVVDNIGDEGVTGLCISSEFNRFAPFALATGWQPFDEDWRTVLDDYFVDAFEFYLSLYTDGLAVQPSDLGQNWGGGCFAIERTAITIEGSWIASYLNDKAPNLQYGSTLVPASPQTGERGNLLFSAAWAINADSLNKTHTYKVVELLTSIKAQTSILASGLAIPSDLSLSDAEYFNVNSAKNQLAATIQRGTQVEHSMPFAFGPYGSGWMEPIQIALSSVILGQSSIEEAVAEAQAAYDQMHKSLRISDQ